MRANYIRNHKTSRKSKFHRLVCDTGRSVRKALKGDVYLGLEKMVRIGAGVSYFPLTLGRIDREYCDGRSWRKMDGRHHIEVYALTDMSTNQRSAQGIWNHLYKMCRQRRPYEGLSAATAPGQFLVDYPSRPWEGKTDKSEQSEEGSPA
jgi:hypothetical protein